MTPSPWHWDTVSCYTPHEEKDDKSVTKIVPFISSEPWIRSNGVPVTNLFSWLDDFCMTMMNDDIAYVGWRWSLSGTPHVSRNLYKYHFRNNHSPANQVHAVDPYWDSKDRQLVKFSENWNFIFVFTRARHWSLSWARWIQSTPSYPVVLRLIFNKIHLRLDLTSSLFPSAFSARKSLCIFSLHYTFYMSLSFY
jgi:hypothetical protein